VADFSLQVEQRTVIGKKVKALRRAGIVPLTVYGPKIQPLTLQVAYRPLEVALMKAGGTNLIDLEFDGRAQTVLARHVQRDYVRGTIIHVDFYAIDQMTRIRVEVPVHLVGVSAAVEQKRGVIITGPNTVTVETLPSKLIHAVEVDLSKVPEVGDSFTIGDLDLGEDITIIQDRDEMLVHISHSAAGRAEEDAEEEITGPSEPELVGGRGKKEDEFED
jgi:large subunit ribosomal protein L25